MAHRVQLETPDLRALQELQALLAHLEGLVPQVHRVGLDLQVPLVQLVLMDEQELLEAPAHLVQLEPLVPQVRQG